MNSSTNTLICLLAAAVLHAAGALWAWTIYLGVPDDPVVSDRAPDLVGQTTTVRLSGGTLPDEQPPVRLEPYKPPRADVVITPTRSRIARRTYVPACTDVSRPTPRELALVERIMRTPPPHTMSRRTVADAASTPTQTPDAIRVPRRQPRVQPPSVPAILPASRPRVQSVGRQADTLPKLLENRPMVYPDQALLARQQGTVLLRVRVEASGRVGTLEVFTSSGHPVLDAEAVRTVRTWRFVPATRDGRPVAYAVRLPVRFSLE